MTAPVTTYKGITLPEQNVTATWGDALNNGPFTDLDKCLGGIVTKSLTNANVTLTAAESKAAILRLTGALSGNVQITTLTGGGFLIVQNATTGNYLVTITNGVGAVALVARGISTTIHIDATNGCFLAGARASTVGQVAYFTGTTISGGWLEADGSLLSRTDYAALWAYAQASGNIQTDANWTANSMYGCFSTGDGSTNFRIPALGGQFIRPWSHNSVAFDVGRTCGQFQWSDNLSHQHYGTTSGQSASHHHDIGIVSPNGGVGSGGNYPLAAQYNSTYVGTTNASNDHSHTVTVSSSGGSEARPINTALLCCISYL